MSTKQKEDPNRREKRFSIEKGERKNIEDLQLGMSLLTILRKGLDSAMYIEIAEIRRRLDIPNLKVEDGWERMVDFDPNTYEMVVIDVKKAEKQEEGEKESKERLN
jgi:hypothetical protein